jgi:hypothetical protein
VPGCPALAVRRGRCQAHARELELPWEREREARGALVGSAHTGWRKRALEAAGNRCADCGRQLPADQLEVHHMRGLADPRAVEVLCVECHRARHRFVVLDV